MYVFRLNVATDGKVDLQLLVLLIQFAADYIRVDCIDNEILSFVHQHCHQLILRSCDLYTNTAIN